MKQIMIIITVVLCALDVSARTFVLITGVSNYQDSQMNLSQTTKDAKEFMKVIETQTKDITLLTSRYANKENILSKLTAICNRAQKDDRIIFFYSGHGMRGGMYVYDDVIYYDELIELLAQSAAKEKICFIDACHAGSLGNGVFAQKGDELWIKSVTNKKGTAFFVACRGDEYSVESFKLGAGYFTQALIKGMRGKADDNQDREITIMELFKYIYKDVTTRTKKKQHPQLIAPRAMYGNVVMTWK